MMKKKLIGTGVLSVLVIGIFLSTVTVASADNSLGKFVSTTAKTLGGKAVAALAQANNGIGNLPGYGRSNRP